MGKIAIVYYSKTGFAEKYAKEIANRVSGEIFNLKWMRNLDKVKDYDTIVYVASIMGGRMNGYQIIDKNIYDIAHCKKIFVAVGLTPVLPMVLEQIKTTNTPYNFDGKIKFYQLRGGFNMKKLGLMDRLLMKNVLKRFEKQDSLNEVEQELKDAIVNGADHFDANSVNPIVDEILAGDK